MWVLGIPAAVSVILQSGDSGAVVPREKNQPRRLFHAASALNKDALNHFVVTVDYFLFSDCYMPLPCPLLLSSIDLKLAVCYKQPLKSRGSCCFSFPLSFFFFFSLWLEFGVCCQRRDLINTLRQRHCWRAVGLCTARPCCSIESFTGCVASRNPSRHQGDVVTVFCGARGIKFNAVCLLIFPSSATRQRLLQSILTFRGMKDRAAFTGPANKLHSAALWIVRL